MFLLNSPYPRHPSIMSQSTDGNLIDEQNCHLQAAYRQAEREREGREILEALPRVCKEKKTALQNKEWLIDGPSKRGPKSAADTSEQEPKPAKNTKTEGLADGDGGMKKGSQVSTTTSSSCKHKNPERTYSKKNKGKAQRCESLSAEDEDKNVLPSEESSQASSEDGTEEEDNPEAEFKIEKPRVQSSSSKESRISSIIDSDFNMEHVSAGLSCSSRKNTASRFDHDWVVPGRGTEQEW
ncbi:hypothetical protein D9756_007290 [Leucocoprinus leucothites]|uniref:Uncharacterized protein n=1 Tax=Leucocoprinus leucothites TaxID=201217 RepID=A0A8H5D7H6_9AGAR|nr:hypothetical protein D9756_007290 [Leucoagaricus leucothites]